MADTTASDRLIIDPNVSETSPCIKGTWVAVSMVVSEVVDGWTWTDILMRHPEITEDDIRACLAWGIENESESIRNDVVMTRGHDRSDELRLKAEVTRLRAVNAELVVWVERVGFQLPHSHASPGLVDEARALLAKVRKGADAS